jgi:hypothetical protein
VNKVAETAVGVRTYLRCKAYTTHECPAKAYMEEFDKEHMYCSETHNHCSNAPKVEAKLIVQKQMERAVANPQIDPRVLYGNMLGNRKLLPNVRAAIPDRNNFAKSVHQARKEDSAACGLHEPKTFAEILRDMPEVRKIYNTV